jgi:hypothetical protein
VLWRRLDYGYCACHRLEDEKKEVQYCLVKSSKTNACQDNQARSCHCV